MQNRRSMLINHNIKSNNRYYQYQHEKPQSQMHTELFELRRQNTNLKLQLEQFRLINEENRKLINILSQQKQYYFNELKACQQEKNTITKNNQKIYQDENSKQIIINQLKKHNLQLLDKIEIINENLEQYKFMFNAQQQQIQRIKNEKQLIEQEWNTVIKQINKKIHKMYKQNQNCEKENQYYLANMPLDQKVNHVLQRIQKNLAQSPPENKYKNRHEKLILQDSTKHILNQSTIQGTYGDRGSSNDIFQLSI